MGVVNVTPDSFWDGGRFFEPAAAVTRACELVEQGADIIDIGGESTRPGSSAVSEAEEMRRVLPVLEKLAARLEVPLSIDTMKVGLARAALSAGASIVNDVGANREETGMWDLVAESGAGYVCMHMQGSPPTMQENPVYQHVIVEVENFFKTRLERLRGCGVRLEQIILDPGIGFGKKIEHNLMLLGSLKRFAGLDRPLLLGVSRKSFLGSISGLEPERRLAPGLACACWAVATGAQLIRTHDVAETVQAVRMTEAILAQSAE
jgi:dihydropteroate synthase